MTVQERVYRLPATHICRPLWLSPDRPVCVQPDHFWQPAVVTAPKATR